MKTSALLLIFGLFLFSCNVAKPTTDFNEAKKALTTNKWILQDANGPVVSYNSQEVSIEFTEEGTGLRASGFAGCNRFFSGVELSPDHIKFSQPGSTMMACPDLDSETAFLALIGEVNAYEINGKELKLFKDKILLMRFLSK